MDRLREHLSDFPSDQHREWVDGLRRHFGRFRAHMKSQMQAEEAAGFMQPVIDQRPTLAPEVERLREEHREIGDRLDELCDAMIGVDSADAESLRAFGERIGSELASVQQHLEREHLLITSAFNQDIGGNE